MTGSFLNVGRRAWSWAFFDWANSAFATTVMGVFFPIFFKEYWCAGAEASVSTLRLGALSSAASIIVAILSPVLGAVADRGCARKKFLFCFTAMGIVMTGGLWFASKGQWLLAGGLYVFAWVGFAGGNAFYDALLVGVSSRKNVHSVSALGYSLGYMGGGLLFAANILMVTKPGWFNFSGPAEAIRVSFLTVSVWWAVFAVPLFLWVPEPSGNCERLSNASVLGGVKEVLHTLHELRAHKPAFLFLLAYWLYIDGVDTVIRMAVDYGMSLGFPTHSLMVAFLITQFVGFPAAILYGKLGEKIGVRRAIYLGLVVYTAVTIWGYSMDQVGEFYALAVSIGLVQGGVQSLSRSYFARLIPAERSAEFFGFYNMLGKFAAVLGPVLMGVAASLTGNPRAAVVPIIGLFAAGAFIFHFVEEPEAPKTVDGDAGAC